MYLYTRTHLSGILLGSLRSINYFVVNDFVLFETLRLLNHIGLAIFIYCLIEREI